MKYILLLLLGAPALFAVSCDETGTEVTTDNPLKGFIGTSTGFVVYRIDKCTFPWRVPTFSMERYQALCLHFTSAREKVGKYSKIDHSINGGAVVLRIYLYDTDDHKQLVWGQVQAIKHESNEVLYTSLPIVRTYDGAGTDAFMDNYFDECGSLFGKQWDSDR